VSLSDRIWTLVLEIAPKEQVLNLGELTAIVARVSAMEKQLQIVGSDELQKVCECSNCTAARNGGH